MKFYQNRDHQDHPVLSVACVACGLALSADLELALDTGPSTDPSTGPSMGPSTGAVDSTLSAVDGKRFVATPSALSSTRLAELVERARKVDHLWTTYGPPTYGLPVNQLWTHLWTTSGPLMDLLWTLFYTHDAHMDHL